MNIAFILPGIERSGGVKCTVELANALIDRGHRVRLLHRRARRRPISVMRSVYTGLVYPHSLSWTRGYRGEMESFPDLGGCRFRPSEIIIAVGMWASAELAKLPDAPNAKLQYLHGATPWDPGLMKRALGLPVPKILVASYLRPIVESFGGEVLDVVGNGFETQQFYPAVDESLRDGIGFVYGAHEAKAPEIIFRIARRLKKYWTGPLRSFGIERRPRQLCNCQYSRYPSVELTRRIYSRSIVWIVASRSEGFSLPILEAMACGCAVISTDCGGPRDIIANGENGYLVPVGDVDQIVDRARLLAADAQLRARFRANADKILKKFDWKASALRLERVLEALRAR